MMIKNYRNAAITTSISFLLFSYFLFFAQNCLASQNSAEIVFTKSNQTLGNTLTFGLAIADIDLDGDDDIFIANYSDVNASHLWINDGNGNFSRSTQQFGAGSAAHDVDMADLNGDSYPDVFIVNHRATSKIYFNNGDNTFTASGQNFGSVGEAPQTIQLTDIDGDGDKDAYIYNISAPNRIWLNDGSGFFTMKNIDYGGSNSNRQVLADFNKDSFPDLFISMRTEPAQIWMNDGAGNFTNTDQALGGGGDAINCEDIDGDGDIDIVVANYNEVTIWFNQNNTGTFIAGFNLGEGATKCKLFDADLDGDYDLITTHFDCGNKLWLNDGTGTFIFYDTIFNNARVFSIECKDLDGDNDVDVVLGQEPDTGGNSIYLNESIIDRVDEKNGSKTINYNLQGNYPNPFNPRTKIKYSIPQRGFVTLIVYDVIGEVIAKLVNEDMPAGEYEVEFDGSDFSNGVYFYQLITGSQAETKKMILLK
ncbi:MAG TPA: FG-GAP-like repeat-containing protein [bacterium]